MFRNQADEFLSKQNHKDINSIMIALDELEGVMSDQNWERGETVYFFQDDSEIRISGDDICIGSELTNSILSDFHVSDMSLSDIADKYSLDYDYVVGVVIKSNI